MPVKISIAKGTSNPTSSTGLTLGEPAFNYANNTLWMGKGSGNTPVWVGAGICGASGGIAAGLTYQIPTLGAVKDYFSAVSSAFLGTTASYVATFNGATGAVTGVSSFNGLTGAVTGASLGANTFTGLQTLTAGLTTSFAYVSGGLTVGGSLYVNGNLTVSGGVTTSISEVVLIEDNIITLNSNVTGTPTENAGIEIKRGTSANTQILWNESTDKWTFTNNGTLYYDIPTDYVSSFNGLTGAVTGVTVGGANTFTALQTFNSGISTSNLVVSGGVTFGPYSYIDGGGLPNLNTALNPVTIDSAKVQIGDVNGTVNGLKFIVDNTNPDSNVAYLYGNLVVQPTQAPYSSGGIIYSTNLYTNVIVPYSSTFVQLGSADYRVRIGDGSGEGNGTQIYVRDSAQQLDLINANGIINIGDVNGAANSTTLVVDDGGSSVTVNAGILSATGSVSSNHLLSTNSVTFGAGGASIDSETVTFGTTAANQTISTTEVYDGIENIARSFEFFVQASTASAFEAIKIIAIHDGTNTYNTQYGVIRSGSSLCSSYTTTLVIGVGGTKSLLLRATPTNTNTTFKVVKTVIPA